MALKKKIIINGKVTTLTGMHIGGTKDDLGIQSKDSPIIRNPWTNQPYIPGSSIKGKMRTLFELSGQAATEDGIKEPIMRDGKITGYKTVPCHCSRKDCMVCKLFGSHAKNKGESGQARLIFRDAMLSERFANIDESRFIENKSETAIDRDSGKAADHALRTMERVAAGVDFDYQIVALCMDDDNPAEIQAAVENGLRMIEATGLGGKISSGSGQVDFHIGEDSYKVEITDFV